MNIGKGDVVKITDFRPQRRIVWCTKLYGGPDRGLVLMPTPFEPNITSGYMLTVAGIDPSEVIFQKIENNIFVHKLDTEWSVEKGTAGGCRHFSRGASEQWLDNSKVVVAAKKDTRMTVVLFVKSLLALV